VNLLRLFSTAFSREIRRMNMIPRLLPLLLAAAILHGCASTDYQPLESSAPITGQGIAGTRKAI
jgi:hypothetical protein